MNEIEFFNHYGLRPLPGFNGKVNSYEIRGHNSGVWGTITLYEDSDGTSYKLRISTDTGGLIIKERRSFAAVLKAAVRELPKK